MNLIVKIQAVRFNCLSGEPTACEVTLQKDSNPMPCVKLSGGPTGYESFVLDGPAAVDLHRMVSRGWWACAGTPGRWDALYIHGIQLAKAFTTMCLFEERSDGEATKEESGAEAQSEAKITTPFS